MKIQERIEKLLPDSKVEWDCEKYRIVVHTKQTNHEKMTNIIVKELDKIGLLRAVESIQIKHIE